MVKLMVMYTFLRGNGRELVASDEVAVVVITALAARVLDELALGSWLKAHSIGR